MRDDITLLRHFSLAERIYTQIDRYIMTANNRAMQGVMASDTNQICP